MLILLIFVGLTVFIRLHDKSNAVGRKSASEAIPVNVAAVEQGSIELKRMFSGTLEASAEFVVAPKVGGRVEILAVDLADQVTRGQEIARLDDDEYVQAVAQARADLVVAKANLAEARSALEIAARELNRIKTLRSRGVASESQLDVAMSGYLQKQAGLEVTKAQQTKAEAFLQTSNIKLGYTRVTADWSGDGAKRVVAERHVDEGSIVSANTPLVTIIKLDPVIGVVFITEKDYVRLKKSQPIVLTTDAFSEETFVGHITRIAPVFNQATRQARVEITIDNPAHKLKPGMFIRVAIVIDRVADATIIPEQALTRRGEHTGIFLVDSNSHKAIWQQVEEGIFEDGRVQVKGDKLSGLVVTLGQQLLDDGSSITISEDLTVEDQTANGGAVE